MKISEQIAKSLARRKQHSKTLGIIEYPKCDHQRVAKWWTLRTEKKENQSKKKKKRETNYRCGLSSRDTRVRHIFDMTLKKIDRKEEKDRNEDSYDEKKKFICNNRELIIFIYIRRN